MLPEKNNLKTILSQKLAINALVQLYQGFKKPQDMSGVELLEFEIL